MMSLFVILWANLKFHEYKLVYRVDTRLFHVLGKLSGM